MRRRSIKQAFFSVSLLNFSSCSFHVPFSVVKMHQTVIAVSEGRVICRRPAINTTAQPESSAKFEDEVRKEICVLKRKLDEISARVEKLEKAAIELVDLTADDSFDSTVSVHTDDLSDELANGI